MIEWRRVTTTQHPPVFQAEDTLNGVFYTHVLGRVSASCIYCGETGPDVDCLQSSIGATPLALDRARSVIKHPDGCALVKATVAAAGKRKWERLQPGHTQDAALWYLEDPLGGYNYMRGYSAVIATCVYCGRTGGHHGIDLNEPEEVMLHRARRNIDHDERCALVRAANEAVIAT